MTFSLKLLLLVTTLVCILLAGWSFTVNRGAQIVETHILRTKGRLGVVAKPEAPFVLSALLKRYDQNAVFTEKTYYLWVFGSVVELPFKSEVQRLAVRPLAPPPP
jgi:hypothetical protein